MGKKNVNLTIKLPLNIKALISFIKEENYIFFSFQNIRNKFIKIPSFIFSFIHDDLKNTLTFCSRANEVKSLEKFYTFLINWLRNLTRSFRKKLTLKGLGYKAILTNNNELLELKLGLSHIVKVLIPKEKILIKVNKQAIVVEGCDKSFVGSFAAGIKNFKVPDMYKGKGIWYKNEKIILKELKKK
jgi:large subunit ribosomal protein L6